MKRKYIANCLMTATSLLMVNGLASCEEKKNDIVSDKEVSSIKVESLPTKTEYFVDDTFSAEGGTIKVEYQDSTNEVIPMTNDGVELTEPDMTKAGDKTITVKYQNKRDRFKISVVNQGFTLTYDLNYDGAENITQSVTKNSVVKNPNQPTRSGYTFYNWYADEDCTVPYDFTDPIVKDTTVYASWKEDGKTYYTATYSLNYYGSAPDTFIQIVKAGDNVRTLGLTPTRLEYSFDGWYADENGTTAFSNAAITQDTTIYAKWTKTKTGSSTYVFEAEETNLTGKTGPGFSGSAQEGGMIIPNTSASNGKAVSYMYKNGNSLEFYIASDENVSDAKVILSLAAEMDNINFNSTEFQVIANGNALSYSDVSLPNNETFSDAITLNSVNLTKGANLIQLKVNNSKRPLGTGSTYSATAPMIDCLKITTSAVLTWDQNYKLPFSY